MLSHVASGRGQEGQFTGEWNEFSRCPVPGVHQAALNQSRHFPHPPPGKCGAGSAVRSLPREPDLLDLAFQGPAIDRDCIENGASAVESFNLIFVVV